MEGWYRRFISTLLIVYISLGIVGIFSSFAMIAASVLCGHGHTSDATVGTKQRPAAAGGYRLDRPLQRQPHAISRAIASQLQPAHGAVAATLEQSQQLKQTREPLLTVSSLMFTNLTSRSIPITPAVIHVQQTLQAVGQHTHRSVRSLSLFRDNVSQLRKQRKHKKSWVLGTAKVTRAHAKGNVPRDIAVAFELREWQG